MIRKAKKEASKRKLPLRVVFQDEARFGRMFKTKDCWAPKGIRPDKPEQIVREYIYAYGAVSPEDGSINTLVLPRMDGICMNIFLKELSERYEDEFVFMICDGASCHSEGILRIPDNMIIEKLPPYCPQLNPVENIWKEMKGKFFGNYFFNSMDAVEDRLIEACCYFENSPDIIKSITGFNWILSAFDC